MLHGLNAGKNSHLSISPSPPLPPTAASSYAEYSFEIGFRQNRLALSFTTTTANGLLAFMYGSIGE
jgi:hypothetical protein